MTAAVITTKERPILFSGPMVRAILAGRKTVTRRVITPQPPQVESVKKLSGIDFTLFVDDHFPRDVFRVAGPVWAVRDLVSQTQWKCPYGGREDRLWVRESLRNENMLAVYSADGEIVEYTPGTFGSWLWKRDSLPSIHMPRKACRIVLEIKSVRAERLHEITDEDAVNEGFDPDQTGHPTRNKFALLWDVINGSGAWDANPWVWRVEFKRINKRR